MTREFKLKIDWLYWFIILLPTFYMINKDLRQVQMNFFQIATMALVGIMHVNKYVGFFLLWCVFQFVFFPRFPDQGLTLQNVLFGALIYQFVVCFYKKDSFRKYFWALSGVLILSILWCVRQYYQMDPIMTQAESWNLNYFTEYPGFFGLPAFLGNYAAAVLPLSFCVSWVLFPFALIALFFSKSTFSVFAALLATLFFFWFRKRIVFWVILITGGLVFSLYAIKYDLPSGEFGRRLNVWKIVEKEAFKTQFFGHGIGTYKDFYIFESRNHFLSTYDQNDVFQFIVNEAKAFHKDALAQKIIDTKTIDERELQKNDMNLHRWDMVHNEFLQAFYETGLLGVLIIGLYIFDIFKRFQAHARKNVYAVGLISSFIAILIVSFGHFPFHLARLAGPFVCIMALLEVALLESNATRTQDAII